MNAAVGVGQKLDLPELAERWFSEGRRFAMATVVETWGSAPRLVGSHLIADDAGQFEGSVSGGCVEGTVIAEAEQVIADGKPRFLSFGVADETAWQVGLSCGGKISVLVQSMVDRSEGAGTLLAGLVEARRLGNRHRDRALRNPARKRTSAHATARRCDRRATFE